MPIKEESDEGAELLRLLGMWPMPGIVEDGDLGAREQLADRRVVFGGDVARPPTRDEQRGAGEGGRGIGRGKFRQPRQPGADRRKGAASLRRASRRRRHSRSLA